MINKKDKVVVITGASSGVGLYAAKELLERGWFVILACRNKEKATSAAESLNFPKSRFVIMDLDLGSLESVRNFVNTIQTKVKKLDALVCNAATYLPLLKTPARTPEGFEINVATNYFGHFLLSNLLLPLLSMAKSPRLVTLGTVTANSEEFGGKIPIPAPANLGDFDGLKLGFKSPNSMINGQKFKAGKAYKDSKLCTMMMSRELHNRFHSDTRIIFSTLYPGCVADTELFRNSPKFFQKIFPWFQQHITKGYVSQELSGIRVAKVVEDFEFGLSGQHWSWGNRQTKNRPAFSQELSSKATDIERSSKLWDLTAGLVRL